VKGVNVHVARMRKKCREAVRIWTSYHTSQAPCQPLPYINWSRPFKYLKVN